MPTSHGLFLPDFSFISQLNITENRTCEKGSHNNSHFGCLGTNFKPRRSEISNSMSLKQEQ